VLDLDFVCYNPDSEAEVVRGAETIKDEVEWFRTAFPDPTYTI
jgi:hypothetical protein